MAVKQKLAFCSIKLFFHDSFLQYYPLQVNYFSSDFLLSLQECRNIGHTKSFYLNLIYLIIMSHTENHTVYDGMRTHGILSQYVKDGFMMQEIGDKRYLAELAEIYNRSPYSNCVSQEENILFH